MPRITLTRDLHQPNLIVGGCSFTYNYSTTDSSAWPSYLRDRCGFEQLFDCSQAGAGNYHISNAIQWCIEEQDPDPSKTFVVVMWSGYNRDSVIAKANALDEVECIPNLKYNYNNQSVYLRYGDLGQLKELKSNESRAVENYLYVSSLYNYLQNRKIPFVFLDFLDRSLPNRTNEFDIGLYLPAKLQQRYHNMFAPVRNLYEYALHNDMLSSDDFHPSPIGPLWTDEVLVPYLIANGVKQS